jgi:hypothetical protein
MSKKDFRLALNSTLALIGRESRGACDGPHPFLTTVLQAVGEKLSGGGIMPEIISERELAEKASRGERLLGEERERAIALARHHAPYYAGLVVARVA